MATKKELLELQQTLYRSKNPTRKWLHCSRRDWIFDALNKISKKNNDKAIEIGPGSGVYLPIMSKLFKEVVASDVEDAYLEHAKLISLEHKNIKVITDDITSSNIQKETFDTVLCSEVIEHIQSEKSSEAIRGMYKILKPGGKLILSTPQKYSTLELVAKIAFLPVVIDIVKMIYQEPIIKTGHINLMTEEKITEQLKDSGFKIIEKYKTGFYIPLISEFTGNTGLNIAKYLEKKFRDYSVLSGVLWTQYFIATK